MLIIILLLNLLNFVGLLTTAIIYFKKNYVICNKELYDTLLEYWGDHHDELGNELCQELAGGVGVETGFFREALYEEEEEPEDE